MKFFKWDPQKAKQAVTESVFAFGAFFALSFLGWVTGLGDLPSLDALAAAGRAGFLAGMGAAAKALLWYFTGVKVTPNDDLLAPGKTARRTDPKGR